MSNAGRPKVLDAFKQSMVCAIVSQGASQRQAAAYIGCAPSTIQNQAQRDPEFARKLEEAEFRAEFLPLSHIQQHSARSWRAAAWFLERKFPDDYARRPPNSLTRPEVRELIVMFARAILDEISDEKLIERILDSLNALTARLRGDDEPGEGKPDVGRPIDEELQELAEAKQAWEEQAEAGGDEQAVGSRQQG